MKRDKFFVTLNVSTNLYKKKTLEARDLTPRLERTWPTQTIYQDLKDSIDSLTKVVTEGFATIHSDMDKLRNDFKADLDEVGRKIRELESSLTYNQCLKKPSKLRSNMKKLWQL